jgi:23S rRNA (pseudouridine1915-N3)-methyltransferase
VGRGGRPSSGRRETCLRVKIRIIAVGHKMPDWVELGCTEYLKRMPREATVDLVELKPDKRAAGKGGDQVRESEAQRILEAAGRDYLIALDERGQEPTTLQLADRMQQWMRDGRDIALAIGGADGLHDSVKQAADWQWSLSKLTLPHGMVRVMLAEQLYRAWSVLNNHPYHRGDL